MNKPTSRSSSLLLAALLLLLLLTTAISSSAARQLASNNGQPYGFPYFGTPWYGGNSGFPGGGGPYDRNGWSNYNNPTTICKEKGPCYNKKLSCPAKCYRSWSNNGRNSKSVGSSGGCTLDCRMCASYC